MRFTVFSGAQIITDQLRLSDIKVTTIINCLTIGLSNLNCTSSLSYTNNQITNGEFLTLSVMINFSSQYHQ